MKAGTVFVLAALLSPAKAGGQSRHTGGGRRFDVPVGDLDRRRALDR